MKTKKFCILIVLCLLIVIISLSGCTGKTYVPDKTPLTTTQVKEIVTEQTLTNPVSSEKEEITTTTRKPQEKRAVEIEKISHLIAASDTSGLNIRFKLTDYDDEDIKADGIISVKIMNDNSEEVYTKQFEVESTDFKYKGYLIGGGTLYEWYVPFSDIKKGDTQSGKVSLSFTTLDSRSFSGEGVTYNLPYYTEDEIVSNAEEEYKKTTTEINKEITHNKLKIELVTAGKYSMSQFITRGGRKNYTRIDLRVTNNGKEKVYFFPIMQSTVIVDNRQYKPVYTNFDAEYDDGDIYPGITQEGALFFEGVDSNHFRLVIEQGYVNADVYEYKIDLK